MYISPDFVARVAASVGFWAWVVHVGTNGWQERCFSAPNTDYMFGAVSDKHRIPIGGREVVESGTGGIAMTATPKNDELEQIAHERHVPSESLEPKPWTAPDFVERSTCAEIGAYAFQDR